MAGIAVVFVCLLGGVRVAALCARGVCASVLWICWEHAEGGGGGGHGGRLSVEEVGAPAGVSQKLPSVVGGISKNSCPIPKSGRVGVRALVVVCGESCSSLARLGWPRISIISAEED